jgi:MFS family permease
MSVLGAKRTDAPRPHIRFIDVLRNRDFAILYAAEMQSLAGDQLARIALSVLVFNSTHSASATAATYAATFLPAILGGYTLARVGDHLPRRAVMAGCDALRAACFVSMAIPGLPIIAVIALLVVAVFIGPAFTASEVSYLAAHFSAARFSVANVLRMSSGQVAQVTGFALGGVAVALLGARGALVVNAGTFAVSALAIGTGLRGRTVSPRLAASSASKGSSQPDAPPFVGLWRDVRLRSLVALALLIGFFVVPEGLAVPYGRSMHASTIEVGLLLASIALGGAAGATLLVRVSLDRRSFMAEWMAVACGVPLAAAALTHHLSVAIVCWLASGLFAAYVTHVVTAVVQRIPDARRSHLVGIVAALLLGAQGLGLLIFGTATRVMSPGEAVGTAGLLGSACALALVAGPLRRAHLTIPVDGGVPVSG